MVNLKKITQNRLNEIFELHEPIPAGRQSAPISDNRLDTISLSNCSLQNKNLRTADFSEALIENTDFRGSDLTGATFEDSELVNCNFDGVLLNKSCFAGASISGCTFRKAQMNEAEFYRTFVSYCNFMNASLRGCVSFGEGEMYGIVMLGCDITGGDIPSPSLIRFLTIGATHDDVILIKKEHKHGRMHT